VRVDRIDSIAGSAEIDVQSSEERFVDKVPISEFVEKAIS